MFDPLLKLQQRRRRMLGVPQVQGNVLPPTVMPDIGADIQAAPPPAPMQMMQPPPMQPADPAAGGLAQLGAERGMSLLMKKLQKPEADADSLKSLPVLKGLFRR